MTAEIQRPDACSVRSARADEPLHGTAPHPRAWLALEQPGPWGRKAPSASHLDHDLGRAIDLKAKAARVTFVLIRRPGRHADRHEAAPRHVIAAHPSSGWMEQGACDDPAALLELDFEAIAGGQPPSLAPSSTDPLALICTNARRDLCCAEVGRDRVNALAPELGAALWESSHLGGHRFAPTVLLLPSGHVLGRASAQDVLDAWEGRVPLHAYRGSSALEPAAQAAQAHVLGLIGTAAIEVLEIGAPHGSGPWTVTVNHPDGREWCVNVEAVPSPAGQARPESCGRDPEPFVSLVAKGSSIRAQRQQQLRKGSR